MILDLSVLLDGFETSLACGLAAWAPWGAARPQARPGSKPSPKERRGPKSLHKSIENYLQKFVIHASVPVALMITLYASTVPARLIHASNLHGLVLVREYLVKLIVVLILIMYPGLCVRTFLVLKCSNHENLLGSEYLMVDYAVQCWTSYHMKYVILSFVSIGIYVVGVPLMVFLFLRKNKDHLFDEASPKHEALVLEMGSLYTQYEKKYWYVCLAC